MSAPEERKHKRTSSLIGATSGQFGVKELSAVSVKNERARPAGMSFISAASGGQTKDKPQTATAEVEVKRVPSVSGFIGATAGIKKADAEREGVPLEEMPLPPVVEGFIGATGGATAEEEAPPTEEPRPARPLGKGFLSATGALRKEEEDIPTLEVSEPATEPAAPETPAVKAASLPSDLRRARKKTNTSPTENQITNGNYRKGRLSFQGLSVALENPKGTTRRGVSSSGVAWSRVMEADYGYFTGTEAADGDAVDCFIGPDIDSEFAVVVDQYQGDKFDESKVVLGVTTREQGEALYLVHYPRGWKLGPTSTTTVAQLKAWLATDGVKRPFKDQMLKAAAVEPFHDWDGTIIPKLSGNAKTYLASLKALTPKDLLPDGVGHTAPIDIATARPPIFHDHIRLTAERLGVPVGEIHHAADDKIELLREHRRPIIDDDERLRGIIRDALGDSFAMAPKAEKAAADTSVTDGIVAAMTALPEMLAKAFKALPAPVMALRPQGSWIIEVSRDKDGAMSKMKADFHETK